MNNNYNNKHLYTFDISSHIHRCYHMAVKQGRNKNAGEHPDYIINNVLNLIQKEIRAMGNKNSHIVFVFESNENNFRHELYDQYKINREKSPDDLVYQKRLLFRILKEMGFCTLYEPNVEADDVIASLVRTTTQHNIQHTIFTKDKDLMALVDENTSIYRGESHGFYNRDRVIEEIGIEPHKMIDYLTMIGDKSDNIDGIMHCGDKSAKNILKTHSLDEIIKDPKIIESLDGVFNKGKIIQYIEQNKKHILLMKELVKLKSDLSLNVKLSNMVKAEFDYNLVQQIKNQAIQASQPNKTKYKP